MVLLLSEDLKVLPVTETVAPGVAVQLRYQHDVRWVAVEEPGLPQLVTWPEVVRPDSDQATSVAEKKVGEKAQLDTGFGKVRSVTGYSSNTTLQQFDFNGNYIPDLYSRAPIRERLWQEAFDVSIDTIDRVDLILGATYYNLKTDYANGEGSATFLGPASYSPFTYPDPAPTIVPLSEYRKSFENFFFRTKEAWAVFADVTFKATDQLSINVGGRYSKETQRVSGSRLNYVTATGPTQGSLLSCSYSRNGETYGGLTCLNGPSARSSTPATRVIRPANASPLVWSSLPRPIADATASSIVRRMPSARPSSGSTTATALPANAAT